MATSTWKKHIQRSYGYARALAKLFGTLVRRSPPVLIYQMGSAGSTSIRNSLRHHYPGLVHRTHGFGPNTASPIGQLLYRFCIEQGLSIRIISIVRDPIAHNISHFFRFYPNWVNKNGENWPEDTSILKEGDALVSEFMEHYPHERVIKWFDNYDKDVGVNVYNLKFDSNKGYKIFNHEGRSALFMQLEINDKLKEGVLSRLLGIKSISIKRANKGDEKSYSDKYSSFLDKFEPKYEYIEKMYYNRYFNHFYGDERRSEFIKKWRA